MRPQRTQLLYNIIYNFIILILCRIAGREYGKYKYCTKVTFIFRAKQNNLFDNEMFKNVYIYQYTTAHKQLVFFENKVLHKYCKDEVWVRTRLYYYNIDVIT